jgi:hypothetical protein
MGVTRPGIRQNDGEYIVRQNILPISVLFLNAQG